MLGPLAGRGDEAWFHAPPGKWCPGQVVDHVTNSLELSARGWRDRVGKPPMRRRPRSLKQILFWFIVSRLGRFGPRRQAPERTVAAEHPERAMTERRLRAAVADFQKLEQELLPARARDLFLKHPVFGDLTFSEWWIFHRRHAAHHARQVRERLP